jgi:glycosyltransferase involved in cell wall biosynthesis
MPQVSVIIPAYNRKGFAERAIASALAQTHQDLEVILVDDGSEDEIFTIAGSLAEADQRIRRLRHATRKGAQAARNTGIKAALGMWIAFLDSDDEWLPDSLTMRLQAAERAGVEVAHSDCYILEPEDAQPRLFGIPRLEGQVYRKLLQNPGPAFPSLLVSQKALERIGYLDESIVSYQEWDTSIRLAKEYEFAFVAEPTFIYDCRHANTISKDLLRSATGYEQVITKHRWSILRYLGPGALASHYRILASVYAQADDQTSVHRCSRKAHLLQPLKRGALVGRAHRLLGLKK